MSDAELPVELEARLATVLTRIENCRSAAVSELAEFLRIPSVSADPHRAGDVAACARWLAGRIEAAGLHAEVKNTPGHPVVLACNEHRAGRPTVLLYGHYDVQPPDPIEGWMTPPFEPVVRNTDAGTPAIFARGAADDKGQIWAHLQAMAAWESVGGGLPVNLVALLEGEEEIDSHHLAGFIAEHRSELAADVAVVSDTNGFARGVPAITTGLRGLVYSEVTLRVAPHDLHSGIHGGAVRNPALALARLLAGLHDANGQVTLDGFYDEVIPPAAAEIRGWERLRFDQAGYAASLQLAGGQSALTGETGYSTLQRRWARPTCDVCGLTSGYQGPGAKTIIPAAATAKVSFRLVARQDPLKVRAAFDNYIREHTPAGLLQTTTHFAAAPAALVSSEGRWIAAATAAVHRGFGVVPVLLREGLTIPVVNLLKASLGLDTLLVGFGLPDDRPHAPNEKFDLDALSAGSRTAAALYAHLAHA